MNRRFACAAAFAFVAWCALRPAALEASSSAVVQAHIRISVCGNAVAEGGEDCDGADLGGRSCGSLGFSGGALACAVDCSFDVSQCAAGNAPHGSGGDSPHPVVQPVATQVIFSGQAYPSSQVTLLKDGQIAAAETADGTGAFAATVSGLSGGSYQFSLNAVDARGRHSSSLSFPLQVASGLVTRVSQILIAPTVEIEDAGDGLLTVKGQSLPNAFIYAIVDGEDDARVATVSDGEGNYLFQLDAGPLAEGPHQVSVKAASDKLETALSMPAAFTMKKKQANVVVTHGTRSDLDGDGRINLVDFSVMAFWYGASAPPARADLNGDGKVDLKDFSILAYYWTG